MQKKKEKGRKEAGRKGEQKGWKEQKRGWKEGKEKERREGGRQKILTDLLLAQTSQFTVEVVAAWCIWTMLSSLPHF